MIPLQTSDHYFLILPTGFSKSSNFKLRGHDQDVIIEGTYIFELPQELETEVPECPYFEVPFSVSHRLPPSVYSPTERHPVRFQSCCGIIFMFEGRKSTLKQPVFSEITCRSFDGSSTKIQAVADLSAVVSPRSPSSPPPQDPAPVFLVFVQVVPAMIGRMQRKTQAMRRLNRLRFEHVWMSRFFLHLPSNRLQRQTTSWLFRMCRSLNWSLPLSRIIRP